MLGYDHRDIAALFEVLDKLDAAPRAPSGDRAGTPLDR
jgi:hypothetical protein